MKALGRMYKANTYRGAMTSSWSPFTPTTEGTQQLEGKVKKQVQLYSVFNVCPPLDRVYGEREVAEARKFQWGKRYAKGQASGHLWERKEWD